ncbi:DUF1508 domain-containing protein [Fulvivirgaceae bacterium PWU5]|uniref:DUF1508 domain-containing protein n=1 Tax=Dawidia cretensis TaxID=2782350 RepID=A0AAP2GW97_9BACT|nr:YegP family protein [Dawidia cretensis]MBT1711960.1 DUF1508 domain-containing protein [Dawidia cretensis]
MNNPKFEIFKAKNGEFYFRFKAGNGKIIIISEGYVGKPSCVNGIDSVKRNAPNDNRYERTDKTDDYRFNLKAENGQVIARSSEGYTTKVNRENAIDVVKKEAPNAPTEDQTV